MERLAPSGPLTPRSTFATAMLVFIFGFAGFERAAQVAGEAQDPRRDVPFGLLISLALVTGIFALGYTACCGTSTVTRGVESLPVDDLGSGCAEVCPSL